MEIEYLFFISQWKDWGLFLLHVINKIIFELTVFHIFISLSRLPYSILLIKIYAKTLAYFTLSGTFMHVLQNIDTPCEDYEEYCL